MKSFCYCRPARIRHSLGQMPVGWDTMKPRAREGVELFRRLRAPAT
jgi:hypothetical protein